MFFEVKIDAETRQYKIGTEVTCDALDTMNHRRRRLSGSIKLTLTNDEMGKKFFLIVVLPPRHFLNGECPVVAV